jgi:hypothetical protein
MIQKKILLYGFFTVAILAVIVFNIKTGNTYPVRSLFNLEALSSESTPGESGSDSGKKTKCAQKHKSEPDPLNTNNCGGGTLYPNYSIMLFISYCEEGANTSKGCYKGTVKVGHDCNNQHFTLADVDAERAKLPYAYGCPKQQ